MTEEQKPKCDVDDIMCQFQVLANLRGIKSAVGEEKFKSNFPELEGLDQKIAEKIKGQESTLKEALEGCGISGAETFTPISVHVTPKIVSGETVNEG